MKVPVQWLKEYVSGLPSAERLAEILTLRGLEVEDVTDGLTGKVIELELTPNRGDCASIVGVARETAAALGKKIKNDIPFKTDKSDGEKPKISIKNQDPVKCPLYFLKLITDLKTAPSPKWLEERLKDCGIRPQNSIVDITNYVLMETGQPLHAFDADKIEGTEIIIREAEKGEKITTLDGIERKLHGGEIVIADRCGPIALAGVMGGEHTAVSPSTGTVLLESACFLPACISRTESIHGIVTESSYRFSRGTDPGGVKMSLLRAAGLMAEVCCGNISALALEDVRKPFARPVIELKPYNISSVLGCAIPEKDIKKSLEELGFGVNAKGRLLHVEVPSYRSDVSREIDIIEEIARCFGYDRIQETMPGVSAETDLVPPEDILERAGEILRGIGFYQVLTPTLCDGSLMTKIYSGKKIKPVELANPLTGNFDILRLDLLSGLLKVALYNINRNNYQVKLYERGSVFKKGSKGTVENEQLAFVEKNGDFFAVKAAVLGVLEEMKQDYSLAYGIDSIWFEKEKSAAVFIKGKEAGTFGVFKGEILEKLDIDDEGFSGCYLIPELFDRSAIEGIKFRSWSEFPSVYRDISVVADVKLTHSEIYDNISSGGGEILRDIRLFDVYTGKGIEKGLKSMTYRLEFNSPEGTLSSAQVSKKMDLIVKKLKKDLSVELR